MAELWEDLRDQIGEGRALLVVGAGVSMGATRRAPAASWPGLLKSGVERCEEVAAELPAGWGERQRQAIASGDTLEMVLAAENVAHRLKAAGEGEYRRWLRETVGSLEAREPATLEALRDLAEACKLPIATTNYDPLLEAVTGRPPVTWLQPEEALRVVRGEEEAILHLHGFWKEPKSVVLGVRSYDDLLRSVPAQSVQQLLALTRSFVFVGCGGTFQDPNFTALLAWLREHFGGVEHRHFRLCLKEEEAGLRTEHETDRIFPVPFGEDYGKLPEYLEGLLPPQPAEPAPPSSPASAPADPGLTAYRAWAKEHYGRLNLVGLGAGEIRLRLDEVYVPLRFAGRGREEALAAEELKVLESSEWKDGRARGKLTRSGKGGSLAAHRAAWELTGDLELAEIFRAGASGQPHVLLLGEPGSGKTTALRKLLHQCVVQGPRSIGLPAETLPVFLRLRRLKDAHLADSLADFLQRELDEAVKEAAGGEKGETAAGAGEKPAPEPSAKSHHLPPGLGRELWRRGRLLLLLDGLDEVADEGLRGRICAYLERELATAAERQVRAVVSCRKTGYGAAVEAKPQMGAKAGRAGKPPSQPPTVHLGESFLHLEVKPLDAQQCRALVGKWFEAAERALPNLTPAEAGASARRLADALDGEDYAAQQLKVLVASPLLLTLLCIVVLRGGEMPRHRAAFYGECLKVLLGSWSRQERGQRPPLDVESALAAVRALAFHLHQAHRRDDLRIGEAGRLLKQALARSGKSVDPFAVLDWLRREAAVLEEYAPTRYGFMHLGLQEYLTALEIASRGEEAAAELASRFGDSWWKEVILLLVGLPGHRLFAPLMRGVLAEAGSLSRHADLIRSCLEEASEVDLGPFLALLDGQVPAERRAAVLRLLLGRREEGLLEKAGELAASGEGEVKTLAERLLREAETPAGPGPSAQDLFLLAAPESASALEALAGKLEARRLGVYEPADRDEWESELPEILRGVRGLGLVVAPRAGPPWELPEVCDCIKLFAEEKKPVIPLLLAGAGRRPAWPEELPPVEWVDLRKGEAEGLQALERLLAGVAAAEAAERPAASGAGEAFTEPLTGIRFLWIPGGRFKMGGTKHDDEQPIHEVELTPFWLGETPVTNREYGVFLKATGHEEPGLWRDRRFSSPEQPVVGVSWEDAQAFCAWLAKESSREVTLPSEAQWEYAARGTDGREYPWGDEAPDKTRACFGLDWDEGRPAPVGSFPAGQGPFGTLDQAGNVVEWCLDVWDEKAYAKREGRKVVDPVVVEGDAEARVLRGGGWNAPAERLRAAFRVRVPARIRGVNIGFRVAVSPPSR